MKYSFFLWGLVGFAVTSLCGTILHFLFGWLGEAVWIAPFSGINESTWEHMKLLFWPMFIFAIVQSFFFKDRKDFWCVKLYGTLLGLAFIPTAFYTYNGIIGKSPDWINIAIFFASALLGYFFEIKLFATRNVRCTTPVLPITILSFIAILFIVFTFIPPELSVFKDPLTGSYGI